ncbi:MAG: SMP-30/gluconolactonase/LRE family protein [Bacteroidota bacterium]
MKTKWLSYLILLALIDTINAQKLETGLFEANIYLPVGSFTQGVEGPAVDSEGILYAVNYKYEGTIGKVSPEGKASVFITLPDSSIGNGIRFNSRGDMIIADYTGHNILKINMKSNEITVVVHDSRMNQPNDIAIDSKDNIYISDPNWKDSTGNLWMMDTRNQLTLLESEMGTVNGIEVSPDDKKLYVNETIQRTVWSYDLSKDGKISNKKLIHRFSDFGLDGMRCDAAGNLYITRYGKGRVVKMSPEGKILKEILLVGKNPSNLTFGGEDGRTIYVTLQDMGNIEFFRVDTPGARFNRN